MWLRAGLSPLRGSAGNETRSRQTVNVDLDTPQAFEDGNHRSRFAHSCQQKKQPAPDQYRDFVRRKTPLHHSALTVVHEKWYPGFPRRCATSLRRNMSLIIFRSSSSSLVLELISVRGIELVRMAYMYSSVVKMGAASGADPTTPHNPRVVP